MVRTASEIDQLVADDFDDEQRMAEQIEELTSRPTTAALQRPCTASVPSRIAQQPSVLACLADISSKDNESEESFYARIIQTARQQQQQQQLASTQHTEKGERRTSLQKQRRESGKRSNSQQHADVPRTDQKRDSIADVYVIPSRTHSPPLGNSRPSTSSSLALSSPSRQSFTSASSSSATPRSQTFDSTFDKHTTPASAQSVSFAHLSMLERDVWYAEQSQVQSATNVSDRPFSRRTSIRSRFPAIGK